MNRSNT